MSLDESMKYEIPFLDVKGDFGKMMRTSHLDDLCHTEDLLSKLTFHSIKVRNYILSHMHELDEEKRKEASKHVSSLDKYIHKNLLKSRKLCDDIEHVDRKYRGILGNDAYQCEENAKPEGFFQRVMHYIKQYF